ncbi:hypothetical protein JCM10908_004597 [Rhodotorula pacifica]|uniref:uncharacterized protein n=1 Tax=Rhodotorula pacifica TaxID=1495444 RepID=UPI0031737C03
MATVAASTAPVAVAHEQAASITRPRRLRRRNPTPACPPKGRYRLSEVAKLPNRIVHPGELIEKELLSETASTTSSSPRDVEKEAIDPYHGVTAGVVRGMKRVKLCDVTMDDVLEGKHTPPLTLRDFEDYLCFRQKSAENLYFYLWLGEYAKLYNAHPATTRPHQDILILSKSFRTAIDTFFSESSPLELNVPSDVRREIDERIRSVQEPEPFLPPSAFDKVHHEASESLAVSFKAFRKQVVRNADRNRGWFAMFLGITTWALGLIPTIVCAVLNKNRGWRALGIPLWWFGPVVALGGWGKTCLVIYAFGDHRQLYPWELAAARAETDTILTGSAANDPWGFSSTTDIASMTERSSVDEKAGSTHDTADAQTATSSNPPSPRHSAFFDLGYIPRGGRPSSASESGSEGSNTRSRRSSTTPGGLYFAPAAMDLPQSSRVWEAFTKQLSPVVARAQRILVATAALYGLVIMAVTAAICLSVPNRN